MPHFVIDVPDIPYTINGKKIEIAVKQAVHGEAIPNIDSISNPDSLSYFEDIDFIITEMENWVVDEKPNLTLSEAIMLSWNIGIAS